MGGKGTYAIGNNVPYSYKTVDKIEGVKVLEPMNTPSQRPRRAIPPPPHSLSRMGVSCL